MKNRVVVLLIGATLFFTACGSGIKDGMEAAKEDTKSKVESVVESTVEEVESAAESVKEEAESVAEEAESVMEEVVDKSDPNVLSDDNPLKGIADPEEMRVIYDEIDDLMNESYLNGPLSTETDGEKIRELEDELIQKVADAHGLTYEDVKTIYIDGAMDGNLYNFDTSALELNTGDILEANIVGTTLIVKAKIESSFSNKATIDQNYYNVAKLIRDEGCGVFSEVQYWAVADMQSGEEGKVISFDVPKDLIKLIEENAVVDNQLGDYVENLWVLPSLQS